ncbi:MAG: hypothetical protein IKC45_02685 [Clostridia bacterium]|nr:hypothetical protein [Clostridia bacterium]
MSKKSEAFSNTFISVLAVLLAVVITFSVVMTAQTFAETAKQNNQVVVNPQVQQNTENDSTITDDSTISDIGGVDEPTDIIVSDTPTEDEEKPDEKDETAGAFASTEELVAYFNTCANKAKTEAVKVVKNSEKRVVGEIKVPDVLQSMAENVLNDSMKDDTKPIVYDTKESIRKDFLVPNQDYVSCLKASDVVKSNYEDKGNEYVIYFKLKDEKNPRAGSGVGSVCDVIETYEVAEKAPAFLKEFSTSYYNCEVTATIDKETGRMVHAVYSTPLMFNVVVNLFGTHSANVGLTFIKDYTITY